LQPCWHLPLRDYWRFHRARQSILKAIEGRSCVHLSTAKPISV
jgi:hypothetical protein